MTTPNQISELLAALDSDPELEEALRQRILTRELLDLPQKVADLADTVSQMTAVFDRRLTAVEELLDGMDGRLDNIDGRLDRIETEQTIMRGQLNNLTGTDYERRIVRLASRLVRRHLGVRSATILVAINRPNGDAIAALLNDGADRGVITEDDADELDRADIILRGSSPEGDDIYVVGEISITIDDSDVDRASDRARILRTASDTTTRAAVIGTSISDANRERAGNSGVTVIIQNE